MRFRIYGDCRTPYSQNGISSTVPTCGSTQSNDEQNNVISVPTVFQFTTPFESNRIVSKLVEVGVSIKHYLYLVHMNDS